MSQKKQRIVDVVKVTDELIGHEEQLERLYEKQGDIQSSLPGLKEAVEKAERAKASVLDEFCEDKCSQDAVSKAQRLYDEALAAEKQAAEVLEVITKKIHDLNAVIHRVKERKTRAEGLLWNEISDQENEILRKNVGDMIMRCYAINRRRFSPLSRHDFLHYVVLDQRDENRLNEFNPEIEAVFQKALRG